MGEIADSHINGEFDFYTGEYLDGKSPGYPRHYHNGKIKAVFEERTSAEKKIASIRKEIAINIQNGMKIEEARKQANLKYGKGWRERGLISNSPNQWSEEELKDFQ